MKLKLLNFIVCPKCRSKFRLEVRVKDKEIKEGRLICRKCKAEYPIKNYIPRIMPRLNRIKEKTAESFGYEWMNFSKLYNVYKNQFLDWIKPLKPAFFRNKIILDAGCGMGRHVYHSSKFGAKEVIGIDFSDSVDVAYENTKHLPNVHIIQSDIFNLPFKQPFDFIYSIGVIHHLHDPEKGFRKLLNHLKPKGRISIWVYGKERNILLKPLLALRKLTTRLPLIANRIISLLILLVLYPIIMLVYKPLKKYTLPSKHFFLYLSNFSFKQIHSIIFDQLIAPIAYYYKKEEIAKWFQHADLKNVLITWRNKNSWRASGVK